MVSENIYLSSKINYFYYKIDIKKYLINWYSENCLNQNYLGPT